MKLTELHDAERDVGPVRLHPHVTIIQATDDARRSLLIDLIVSHCEEHGIGRDALVVTTADLPGHDPVLASAIADRDAAAAAWERSVTGLKACRAELTRTIEERARVAAELDQVMRGEGPARDVVAAQQAERTRLEAQLAAVREHRRSCETTLVALVSEREALQHALDAATARLDKARERRQTAMEEALATAVELEATQAAAPSGGQPGDQGDAVTVARDRLAVAEQEAQAADPDSTSSPVNQRLADLERHRVDLSRRVAATGTSATGPVAEALERVMAPVDGSPPMAAALALADIWRDVHQQLQALDSAVSEAERQAQHRLDAADRAVAEADLAARRPILTSDQIATVEAAHHAVLEAEDHREGRFGSGRAKRKLEELRARETEVLEGLGFVAYADYMMSSSSNHSAASVKDLEVAHAELAASQATLDTIPGATDRARRRSELLARRDAVAPKVAALIGHPPAGPEAEAELRKLREPVSEDRDGIDRLAAALTDAGIEVGEGPHQRADLILLSQSYLDEDARASGERGDLAVAVQAVDAAIAALRAARDRGEVDVPALPSLPSLAEPGPTVHDGEDAARTLREARWAEVEAARAAVVEAEALVTRHRSWTKQIDALEVQMTSAARREREAADALAAVEVETAAVLGDGQRLAAASEAIADAERALTRARLAEFEAEAAIAGSASQGASELQASCGEALRRAEDAVRDAAADEQAEAVGLAAAEAELQAATAAVELAQPGEDGDRSGLLDSLEWALLGRLAGVRGTDDGGPHPLVLDEPFGSLRDDEVGGVLERLSRVAPLLQIVVASDRPMVAEWADSAGPERAAVAVL